MDERAREYVVSYPFHEGHPPETVSFTKAGRCRCRLTP